MKGKENKKEKLECSKKTKWIFIKGLIFYRKSQRDIYQYEWSSTSSHHNSIKSHILKHSSWNDHKNMPH